MSNWINATDLQRIKTTLYTQLLRLMQRNKLQHDNNTHNMKDALSSDPSMLLISK